MALDVTTKDCTALGDAELAEMADRSPVGVVMAATAVAVGAVVLALVTLAVQWLLGGPGPAAAVRSLGAAEGRVASLGARS